MFKYNMSKIKFKAGLLENFGFIEIFKFYILEIQNCHSVSFRLSQDAKYFVPSECGM